MNILKIGLILLSATTSLNSIEAKPVNKVGSSRMRAAPANIIVKAEQTKQDIIDLSNSIAKVEDEADKLDVSIGNRRRNLIESGRIDQRMVVDIVGSGNDAIAALNIHIDTFPIYTFDQTTSMVNPSPTLTVYNGPVNSGQHILEVRGRLVKGITGVSDLNVTYRDFADSFALNLPADPFYKRIKISIDPDPAASKAIVSFSQYDLVQEEKP